jgi:hypothetical protein
MRWMLSSTDQVKRRQAGDESVIGVDGRRR